MECAKVLDYLNDVKWALQCADEALIKIQERLEEQERLEAERVESLKTEEKKLAQYEALFIHEQKETCLHALK